jgi:FlaA1/EpsC-like NDP-sugar epimerase
MRTEEVLQHYSNKRTLITGGAGCIGTNLIKTLLKSGPEKIIVIDDLSASYEWIRENKDRIEACVKF